MRIITAPEEYIKQKDDICVFLAGGISNCEDWQSKVIQELKRFESWSINNKDGIFTNLVIFNPRREDFSIDVEEETKRQIRWEFDRLEEADIFSMYFASGDSVQPICMYELGRNLARIKEKAYHYDSWYTKWYDDRIIIGIEDGYKRTKDVLYQAKLALDYTNYDKDDVLKGDESYITLHTSPDMHAFQISLRVILLFTDRRYRNMYPTTVEEDDEPSITKKDEPPSFDSSPFPKLIWQPFQSSACQLCSANPENGGNGICHCILASSPFT